MRLLTRSDFDGLACGVLLKELGVINSWKFVHPKDIQDGIVEVTENDVLANIPYAKGCKLWFDHHSSEHERLNVYSLPEGLNKPGALSCARVVYDYYNGDERLPRFIEMVKAVDKVDSARLSAEDIMYPQGWVLLGFIMDPRTGLGRFRNFRISNYELMEMLIDVCRSHNIDEILALPDVRDRTDLYKEHFESFKDMLLSRSRADGNVVVTDLRGVDTIFAGNRFLIYSLFPDQNISIWVIDGRNKQNCAIAVGHSVLNRTSHTNVGSLMLRFGGGGHNAVGTCQVEYADADCVISELVLSMKADG